MFTRSVDSKYGVLLATAFALLAAPGVVSAQGYPTKFEFGTTASNQDIAAVAIAVAPDGKGLPAGQGRSCGRQKGVRV